MDHASPPTAEHPVIELVETFFEALGSATELSTAAASRPAEMAYELDQVISTYLHENQLSPEAYNSIQQDVLNSIAANLHEHNLGDDLGLAFDSHGNVHAADVIAALDSHFHELALIPGEQPNDSHSSHLDPGESFSDGGFIASGDHVPHGGGT